MCAVAERSFIGVLAIAKGHFLSFLNNYLLGSEATTFMRTVTKRLLGRFPTGTPPIFTRPEIHDRRHFRCNNWFFAAH